MRTSLFIVFSTAMVASGLLYGDYFQDYSQSSGTSFTDQNRGYSEQPRNSSNWQNPNNTWMQGEYKRANPNENSWTADSNQNQNPNSDQSQVQWRSNTNNQNQPNMTNRNPNNQRQSNYQKGAVSDASQQRSYDSRSAPTNWENSESSGNSVWNTYYDNQNQPAPQNQPQRPRTQLQRTAPQTQQNTNQGAQWVSYDDSQQSLKYTDVNRNADANSASPANSDNSAGAAAKFSNDATQDQNGKNSDLKVTRSVQLALTRDKSLSTLAQHVIVMTSNGQVYLRGNVNNDTEKSKVESIVRNVSGVKSVDNQLNVLNISSQ